MRIWLAVVTALFVLNPSLALADPPPREALAAQLYETLEALAPAQATSRIVKQTLGAFETQSCYEQMQPRIQAMVEKYTKADFSKDLVVKEYAKAFSARDLQAMLDFADTPLGEKWFRTQPRVAAAASNAAMTHFQKHQIQIAQETMAIIQEFQGKECGEGE